MPDLRLIKKYPNRRLYDTQTSSYITVTDIKALVLSSEPFKVVDAKTNEDLTRSILLQIILEEESVGAPLFSTELLEQMIRFYGNAMQTMMGQVLEKNIQAFVDFQERFKEQSRAMVGEGALNPTAFQNELWSQWLGAAASAGQGGGAALPGMPGVAFPNVMGSYVEQSQQMFQNMPNPFMPASKGMFPGFSFVMPGAGSSAAAAMAPAAGEASGDVSGHASRNTRKTTAAPESPMPAAPEKPAPEKSVSARTRKKAQEGDHHG